MRSDIRAASQALACKLQKDSLLDLVEDHVRSGETVLAMAQATSAPLRLGLLLLTNARLIWIHPKLPTEVWDRHSITDITTVLPPPSEQGIQSLPTSRITVRAKGHSDRWFVGTSPLDGRRLALVLQGADTSTIDAQAAALRGFDLDYCYQVRYADRLQPGELPLAAVGGNRVGRWGVGIKGGSLLLTDRRILIDFGDVQTTAALESQVLLNTRRGFQDVIVMTPGKDYGVAAKGDAGQGFVERHGQALTSSHAHGLGPARPPAFCGSCGQQRVGTSAFCTGCGAPFA